MRAGSTLVGFEVKGGKAAAFRALNALKLARISNNLGDAKSLVTHPATTTHQRLTPEARAELGISEGFIRFSAGLEHRDDLIEDLQRRWRRRESSDREARRVRLLRERGTHARTCRHDELLTSAGRSHTGRHVDAELDLPDRFDDVVAEQLGETGITPVVHVQAVGDDEIVDRDRLLLVPVAHDLEAREDADVAKFGDLAAAASPSCLRFRARSLTRGEYCGSTSTTIGARGLNAGDAVLHQLCGLAGIEIAQHRVGADLPDHQIRLHVDHFRLQPLHHLRRVFAALAAIDAR